jgi:hypothetical protein
MAGDQVQFLSQFIVTFRGPPLTRMMRGAISAAAIRVVEGRPDPSWGGQMKDYTVSVDARDDRDAITRVQAALRRHGSYSEFSARRDERSGTPRV